MINDVYLYFSDDFTKTKASTQAAAQTITVADGAPFAAMRILSTFWDGCSCILKGVDHIRKNFVERVF